MEKTCSVEGCNGEAEHKVSYVEAKVLEEKEGLKLKVYHSHPPRKQGVVYLCSNHYKLWKKYSRSDRKLRGFVMRG